MWPSVDEALGMRRVRGGEHRLPMRADRGGLAEVHDRRREEPEAAVMMVLVVPAKERLANARPSAIDPKRSGNCGQYFRVLNWASEKGLSLDTCGRLWVLVTPRSARSSATGLLFIEAPRSACSVSWPGLNAVLRAGLGDQALGERRALVRGQHPADDVPAEDVEDDVEIEVRPLGRAQGAS